MRKNEIFWEYAEDLNGRFKCKLCKKEFWGTISRVKSHLSGITRCDIVVCVSVPDDVQADAVRVIGDGNVNKKTRSSTMSVGFQGDACSGSEDQGLQQGEIPIMVNGKNKEIVDKKVAHCFIQNNISCDVIQTPTFIEMDKAISDFSVGYSLHSYSTRRGKLVPESKTKIEAYMDKVKESWKVIGCTIISYIWTKMKQKYFINGVAYSPKGVVFLKSFERSDHRNTGMYIRDTLMSVIDEVGVDNIMQIVTDNASNYNVASELIMADHPHLIKTKCVAHGVQLLLEDYYKKVGWVKDICQRKEDI